MALGFTVLGLSLVYPSGVNRSPSNFVRMRRKGGGWHASGTMTHWLFLAAEQPLGLTTHLAQLASMVFSPKHVRPRDSVGRMFDLHRLSDG